MRQRALLISLVGAMASLALPLLGTPTASADAVIGSVTDLGQYNVDVNGAPAPVSFQNAAFGPRYLYESAISTADDSTTGRAPWYLTALDLTTGQYVDTWRLPDGMWPVDPVIPDGDTVWISHYNDTKIFKVGQPDPVADFPGVGAIAIAYGRAYLFGDTRSAPALTVLDDDSSSPDYLAPISVSGTVPTPYDAMAVATGGDHMFVVDQGTLKAVQTDPASPNYLAVTGTAATDTAGAPPDGVLVSTDAAGDRVLAWRADGAIAVYDLQAGQLVPQGSIAACPANCGAQLATLSPDGRLVYVTSPNPPDEVRVYDATTPSHPQVGAIESFAGAGTMTVALSPDGTTLTTGGEFPKLATVTGYASAPTISGPDVPVPGDTLSVDPGYWSTAPTWQWLRDGQPITGTTDASTYTLTAADLGTQLTVAASVEGLGTRTSAPVSVPSPPRIDATTSGRPGRAGWFRGPVTVTFTCTRGTGAITQCPAPVTLRDGTNQQASGTVTDQYGLTATTSVSRINVDTVKPKTSLTNIAAGATFLVRLPTPRCQVSDAHPAGCTTAVTASGVDRTLRVTGHDLAGNTGSATVHVHVCYRCLVGASYASGRWVVRHGATYTVKIAGGARPTAVGLAPSGHPVQYRSVHARQGATVAGHAVWIFRVTMPTKRGAWALAYRAGGDTSRLPLTVD